VPLNFAKLPEDELSEYVYKIMSKEFTVNLKELEEAALTQTRSSAKLLESVPGQAMPKKNVAAREKNLFPTSGQQKVEFEITSDAVIAAVKERKVTQEVRICPPVSQKLAI